MIVELTSCVITRPSLGLTLARGPVLAARGSTAVGAILGPLEVQAGDRVAITAEGRYPSVWEIEAPFTLVSGTGTFSACALVYFPLDEDADWDVDKSLRMYKSKMIDYTAGAHNPAVRIVLS